MTNIFSALGLIGIGSMLKSAFDFFIIEDKKRKDLARQELKDTRYKSVIILCYTLVHYESQKSIIVVRRPEIVSKEALIVELQMEWINMVLYASDDVIVAMKTFLEKPHINSFNTLAFAMRKSLYSLKSRLSPDDLNMAI